MSKVFNKFNFKKIVLASVLTFALFSASFAGYNFNFKNINNVHASFKREVSLVSNNTFSSTNSSDKPASPSNWTFVNKSTQGQDEVSKIKNGVINVYDTTFTDNKSNYELTDNPGVAQPGKHLDSNNAYYKHLMINAYQGSARAYYESSSFTLAKSSYYAINVTLKTNDNSTRASIYLKGLSSYSKVAGIENINTNGEWEQFTIYISTNEFLSSGEKVNLQLWLGSEMEYETSSGAVFFSEVNVISYSESTYLLQLNYEQSQTQQSQKFVNIELNGKTDSYPVTNANFEQTNVQTGDNYAIAGFKTLYDQADEHEIQTLKAISTRSYNAQTDTKPGIKNPQTNNWSEIKEVNGQTEIVNNDKVLFMHNEQELAQGIESSNITIKKQTLYKLSVWAKSDAGKGKGATLKIVENTTDLSATPTTASLSTATTETTNEATNNWNQYAFYIEGHPLKDTTINLQIWLGTQESKTNGYVFIDNIELQEITYSNYTNGSGQSNTTKFSYFKDSSTILNKNGNFNSFNNENPQVTYPAIAKDWTISSSDENFNKEQNIAGAISTTPSDFEKVQQYVKTTFEQNIENPGLTPNQKTQNTTVENTPNNLYLIGNIQQTTQTLKSSTFTLNADSFYKISFALLSQINQTNNSNLVSIKVSNSSTTVFELTNLKVEEWKLFNIYVQTNKQLSEVAVEISLNNSQGYVFVDDVFVTQSTESIFNSAFTMKTPTNSFIQNNQTINFATNLKQENFTHATINLNQTNPLNKNLFNWSTTSNTESVQYGILNTKLLPSNEFDMINPLPTLGDNVLLISSLEETVFKLTSNTNHTLNSGKFYKLSVFVKTNILTEPQTNEIGETNHVGATVKLSNFDKEFKGINTKSLTGTENEWVELTFYINPSATTEAIVEIGLGYENAPTRGQVFIDAVVLEELEQENYNTEIKDLNSKTELLLTEVVEDNDNDEDNKDKNEDFVGRKFDFFVLSSLILSVAILIALIGTGIRKFKFNPFTNKSPKIKTSYDRRKTLEVDLDRKERIAFRKNIINELKSEQDLIAKETISYNEKVSKELEETQNARKQNSIKSKQEKFLSNQNYRNVLITEEIARIEREIESIVSQERKYVTTSSKQKEQQKQTKLSKSTEKQSSNKTNEITSNESEKIEVSQVVEVEDVKPSDEKENIVESDNNNENNNSNN